MPFTQFVVFLIYVTVHCYIREAFYGLEYAENVFADTPLGKLTTLPRLLVG